MKPILYVKGSSIHDVRLNKFVNYLRNLPVEIHLWSWNRLNEENSVEGVHTENLLSRGGYSNKSLLLYYPVWVVIVFFKVLFCRDIKRFNVIAINFECGLPIYWVSKIRKFDYIYEIYDEFAISHNFPAWLKKMLIALDKKIMLNAKYVIHVDENRVRYRECETIIIENTPNDYYAYKEKDYSKLKHNFAIIGNISNTRGTDEIYKFANANPHIEFILVGTFYNKEFKQLLTLLPNVIYFDRMPQSELFVKLEECCGIFSLYDPSIEINRLAASNKVYDAMMLGIPVITNKEVVNSKFIEENEVGIIVNYNSDSSWSPLSDPNFTEKASEIGKKGRKLYLEHYVFERLIEERFLKILKD